jgi:hypothetical protein
MRIAEGAMIPPATIKIVSRICGTINCSQLIKVYALQIGNKYVYPEIFGGPLFESIQCDYHVTLARPTTFTAPLKGQ